MKILEPHQVKGSDFLARNYHVLLADEPGLGKTLQAVHAANAICVKTALVVAPASVRLHWRQEILENSVFGCRWQVVSYNKATTLNNLQHGPWDLLVLDEAHFLKTPDSQRTKAIFGNGNGIARRAKYIWCLTGTPVLNRPREMFPVLKCLHPGFADMTEAKYDQRYCGAYFDGRAINNRGASRLEELAQKLDGFMLRRTMKQVYPDRKEPIISYVPVELDGEGAKYLKAVESEVQNREAFISSAAENYSQLGDVSRLLHATGLAKVQATVGFVKDLLETREKVVVFTRHRAVLAALAEALNGYMIEGGMGDQSKQAAIHAFGATDGVRVLVANMQAAATGTDGLQKACSCAVFAEQSWVPGEMDQAIGRLHRMGQEDDVVTAYVLHAPETLESAVMAVRKAKERTIERIVR